MLSKKLGENFPVFVWRTRRYLSSKGGTYAKPIGQTINASCPLIVIDYESFIENEIKKSNNERKKTAFRTLLKIFLTLNNNRFYAYAKDDNIILVLSYLGGIYFDADIAPKEQTEFFHSLGSIPLVFTRKNAERSIVDCPLLKFKNPHLTASAQIKQPISTDIGVRLFVNSSDFKEKFTATISSYFIQATETELGTTFLNSVKTEIAEAKKNQNVFYPFIHSLKSPQAAFWMQEYRKSKEKVGQYFLWQSSSRFCFGNPRIESMLRLAHRASALIKNMLHKKRCSVFDYMSKQDYQNFYLQNLYDKFKQVADNEPSSTFYTGYQHLEKMKNAVDNIGMARKSLLQRRTTGIKILSEQICIFTANSGQKVKSDCVIYSESAIPINTVQFINPHNGLIFCYARDTQSQSAQDYSSIKSILSGRIPPYDIIKPHGMAKDYYLQGNKYEHDECPNDINSKLEELCHTVDIIVVKNDNEMPQFKLSQLLESLKKNSYHYKVYYLDISFEQRK